MTVEKHVPLEYVASSLWRCSYEVGGEKFDCTEGYREMGGKINISH